jgi:DNA replication and repair protein RecF
VDGAVVDSLATSPARPLLGVFQPDRLALVKGAPNGRRAHLDSLVAALWPSRVSTRTAYSRVLAQRNALLVRIRAGVASAASLEPWDLELSRHGTRLMADRREACAALAPLFSTRSEDLELAGPAELCYRPRSRAGDDTELAAELLERRGSDLERGFTGHGPHRDELELIHAGESLRVYGSQGQQRVALLALLLAERDLLRQEGRGLPLMLLDDVMSELDMARRIRLAELVLEGGQFLLTTADPDHVPGATDSGVARVEVAAGGAKRVDGTTVRQTRAAA